MKLIKGLFKFLFGLIIMLGIVITLGYFIFLPRFEEKYEEKVFVNKDSVNYLLIGKESPLTLDNANVEGPVHSDTLMLATLYPKDDRVKITSIPRDTYVEYLGNSKKRHQKINAAYFLGGAEGTKDAVEEFLDIEIDHHMVMDYQSIIGIIDTLGGIDIEWEYDDYHYEDNWTDPPLVIDFKRGTNHLDGEKSVSYLRTRKAYPDQDLGRMKAQQQFLLQLFDELKSPKNIILVPKMIKIVNDNTETDLEFKDMLYLAYYGLKNIQDDSIEMNTLEGREKIINGTSYYVVDKEMARRVVKD